MNLTEQKTQLNDEMMKCKITYAKMIYFDICIKTKQYQLKLINIMHKIFKKALNFNQQNLQKKIPHNYMSNVKQEQPKKVQDIDNNSSFPQDPQTKKLNYTYWVDKNNKSRDLPPEQRPQKIDPKQLNNLNKQQGGSAWNKAGTWQPKTISMNEIQARYTEQVNQWTLKNIPSMKIEKITLNGQCERVFIRNKTVLTYEINGKVQFQKIQIEVPQEKSTQNKTQIKTQDKTAKISEQQSNGEQSSGEDKDKISEQNKSKKQEKQKKPKKKKAKTMVFQIQDLTDTGDRDYKYKADDPEDKKFIAQKSEQLLKMLEEIIKSYKGPIPSK